MTEDGANRSLALEVQASPDTFVHLRDSARGLHGA